MTPAERFWSRVQVHESGCWLWSGPINAGGYGRSAMAGTMWMAHRWAYQVFFGGSIPSGFHLDHVWDRGCRYRNCVNPAHMEPVTPQENIRRSNGWGAVNARKTECVKGHPLAGKNLYLKPDGERACRECGRAANREWYHRQKVDL